MKHEREFSNEAERREAEAKRREIAAETASAYARLFTTPDGKRVLEDLRLKFGHDRQRFDIREKNHSSITAALIDGQCCVLREIEQAMKAGGAAH